MARGREDSWQTPDGDRGDAENAATAAARAAGPDRTARARSPAPSERGSVGPPGERRRSAGRGPAAEPVAAASHASAGCRHRPRGRRRPRTRRHAPDTGPARRDPAGPGRNAGRSGGRRQRPGQAGAHEDHSRPGRRRPLRSEGRVRERVPPTAPTDRSLPSRPGPPDTPGGLPGPRTLTPPISTPPHAPRPVVEMMRKVTSRVSVVERSPRNPGILTPLRRSLPSWAE